MAIDPRTGMVAVVTGALVVTALAGCTVSRAGDTPPESASSGTSSEFTPDEDDHDPSVRIDGVVVTEYDAVHTEPGRRVAYEKAPPDGGRHDQVWAACNGVVYDTPVRNEHMVHSLEHGAVWIAYDAALVTGDGLQSLVDRVDGRPYLMLSPYPGLDQPISLQAWGHQLKLADADDPRIDRFVTALRSNPYTAPEPGASCDPGSGFDVTSPPPFEPGPPGPGAAPVGGP